MNNINELHPRTVRYAERAVRHDAIQKILVVVDPTATRHPCIEKAARLAAGFGSTIELYLCDVDQAMPDSWTGGSTLAQYRAVKHEQHIEFLEQLAAPLRASGIHAVTESEWHVPLEQSIVEHAIRKGADLVVKDTHRHAPQPHMPSVQTDWLLIRQLPMPLLLVRPGGWGAHPTIAVSVDPCHGADRPVTLDQSVLSLGCSIGTAVSGRVSVMHALEPIRHLRGEVVAAEEKDANFERQRKAVADLAQDHGLSVSDSSFVERPVPEGIVQLVKETRPAVLVMGVAARQRLQVGAVSTASQVLEQTECDLLLVKPAGFVSPVLVTNT